MQESPCVELSCPSLGRWAVCKPGLETQLVKKSAPASRSCASAAAAGASARICRRHEQQVINRSRLSCCDTPLLPLPLPHGLVQWCSSEAIRAASDPALFPFPHLPLPLNCPLHITGFWSYLSRCVQLLYLTRVPVSNTLRRVHCPHCPHCASGVGWLFARRVAPRRMQVSRTHRNRFMQAEV
jgi:hypothetical protein